jgi:putative methionine-R-sulfoxide reductase with GAF domain
MNFLENRSLKQLAGILLAGMFLVFLVEFLFVRGKIETLEEAEEKKDFARSAQIESQQIAYLVELQINGRNDLSADIFARINELDHKLNILGNGGRIDNTDIFLEPLSRLPSITFKQLDANWRLYKDNVIETLTPQETTDSTHQVAALTQAELNKIKALLPGQWLTLSNWYQKILTDLTEEAEAKKENAENWFLFLMVVDILILASYFLLFQRFVLEALNKLKANAKARKQNFEFQKNEVGEVTHQMNEILEELNDATEFVAAIGEGKLDFDYKTLDSNYEKGKNRLADSLIAMQEKLKSVGDEERKRQWANEGLAKFVDILRSSNDNISVLGDQIISSLVKYTRSNQGGLYLLNDEDERNKHLELISLYAFDIKKYETRKIKLGEGILGQTFLEKETTILNELPDDYIRITSGLGESAPKSLLIVPLKVDKQVYGLVELASFQPYALHEIAFIEKLAETIASTLASVKVGQKNRQLIEQFQEHTEQMRAQEEEMRQNMEELQATQEELARKEQDYIRQIQDLQNHNGMAAEADKLRKEFAIKEEHYQVRIRELEERLAQKPERSDDWALAEELEKTLRIQIEAMKITQQELGDGEKNQ